MSSFVRITRNPYEEPHAVNLIVAASNGRQSGELEIYANATDLKTTADGLRGFPQDAGGDFLWELGSEDPQNRDAFYFRFRVYRLSPMGKCAIEVRFNNNEAPPEREVAEFSMEAYPGDLDRLGALFARFSRLEHRVLEWDSDGGEVR